MQEFRMVSPEKLLQLMKKLFVAAGISEKDAEIASNALIAADIRGIDSHGASRLPYYIGKLKNKTVNPKPDIKILHELPATALVDGDDGLGPVVAKFSMELAIEKARKVGAGLVSVRRSNHYGIAAYYSMMALKEGMFGISMTNAVSMVTPTFGAKGMLGTNPISMSAPTGALKPFVLDMATSAVPLGKIELALKNAKKIPPGWLYNSEGEFTDDPTALFKGGALAPLGGTRELGGHKGYGLALLVDILSAILPGANYGARQEGLMSMRPEPSNVGHFFMAFQVEGFRPLAEFSKTMDEALTALKDSPKAKGQDRIYIHGEPEFECEAERKRTGIPLHPQVVLNLAKLAAEAGIDAGQYI
jgi:LDH2 family malate/lactate/ureidoglycolate dehydrogenase